MNANAKAFESGDEILTGVTADKTNPQRHPSQRLQNHGDVRRLSTRACARAFYTMHPSGLQLLHEDPRIHRRIRTNAKENSGATSDLVISRKQEGGRDFLKLGT